MVLMCKTWDQVGVVEGRKYTIFSGVLVHQKEEMQPIILVDQDGVFCDFAAGYYELAKRVDPQLYAALKPLGTQPNYYIHEHIEDPELRARGAILADHPDLFDMLPPNDGAIEGLIYLSEYAESEFGLDTLIVTAPHTSNLNSYTAKAKWIKKYLGQKWLDKLMIVRDKTAVSGIILIDDKPTPLGKFTPDWTHVIMPHSYNLEQQKTLKVFDGWNKKSIEDIAHFACKIYLTNL